MNSRPGQWRRDTGTLVPAWCWLRPWPSWKAPIPIGVTAAFCGRGERDARLHQTLPDALRDISPLSLGTAFRPAQCVARRSVLTRCALQCTSGPRQRRILHSDTAKRCRVCHSVADPNVGLDVGLQTMRTIGRLTFNKVKNAKPRPGGKAALLRDGGGLWLQVRSGKDGQINKAWIFRYAAAETKTALRENERGRYKTTFYCLQSETITSYECLHRSHSLEFKVRVQSHDQL
jgi:hypothetical protein